MLVQRLTALFPKRMAKMANQGLLVDRSVSPKRSFASPPLLPFSALEHTVEGYPTLLPCQESKVTIATRHGSVPNSALQR